MCKLIVPARYETHQIQYYPDTNFLCLPNAYILLLSVNTCRLIDSSIEEVLAKRDRRAEWLLGKLIGRSGVADEGYFRDLGSVSTLRLLRTCASTLAPEVYGAIRQLEDEHPIPEGRLEGALRALDEAMRTRIDRTESAAIPNVVREWRKHGLDEPGAEARVRQQVQRIRRAWYDYQKKRFKALMAGGYRWTDEHLCAASVAEAFLRANVSVIISSDVDFQVIMKQCTDNLLRAYSRYEALRNTGSDDAWLQYFEREVSIVEKLRLEAPFTKMDEELVLDLSVMSHTEGEFWRRCLLAKRARYLKGTVILWDWQGKLAPCFFYYPPHIIQFAKDVVVTGPRIVKPE